MNMKNIPSEEDFKRAEKADRERNRGLNDVRKNIFDRFSKNGVHEVFMFFSPGKEKFGAFVFYRWNRQIQEAEESGISSQIKDAILDEIEKVGRGNRNTIRVDFKFDSHENVKQNYNGNYYNFLR